MQRQFFNSVKSRVMFVLTASLVIGSPAIASLIGVTHAPSPAVAQTANGRFQTVGAKIYDPSGKEFIVKGTNLNGPNYQWPGTVTSYVDQIKTCWKFNTIRLNIGILNSEGTVLGINEDRGYANWNGGGKGSIDEIVKAYTSQGIVVMIEAHDRTGGFYEGQDLEKLKTFWRNIARQYKNNPYVWFNIANEPGSNLTWLSEKDKWVSMHQEAIKVIRDEVGADNLIVADAIYWGQDMNSDMDSQYSSLINYGRKLLNFNNKSYKNIVFSFHVYHQSGNSSKMGEYMDKVLALNAPLIVGEYGVKVNEYDERATRNMFATAPQRNLGRIVWAWYGVDGNKLTTTGQGGGWNIDSCQNPTNLAWLGQQTWNDNRRQETLATLSGSSTSGTGTGSTASPSSANTGSTGTGSTTSPSPTNTGTGSTGTTGTSSTGSTGVSTGSTGSTQGTAAGGTGTAAGTSIKFSFTSTAPTIDGKKDSFWDSTTAYNIANLTIGSNPNSNGATVRGAWDDTNLYLLIEVKDDKKINGSWDWWKDDSIFIFLDPDNSKDSSYQWTDYAIGVRWLDSTIHSGYGGGVPTGTTFVQADTSTGYTVEVKIPLSSLRITPKNGYKMGIDFQVDGADKVNERARIFQMFNQNDKAYIDPSVLGVVELADKP